MYSTSKGIKIKVNLPVFLIKEIDKKKCRGGGVYDYLQHFWAFDGS